MIYQFTLTDYTINPLGVSTIIEEPNGWDGMELSLKRDEETHGVFFDCSVDSLEFYGEGASIIKAAYDLKKVEAKVDILIECKCADNDLFETLYDGRLVFTNYKYFQKDDCYVQIGIEQKGALIEFRNKIETKVNLDTSTKTALPFTASLPSKGILKTSDVSDMVNSDITNQAQTLKNIIPAGIGVCSSIYKDRYFSIGFDTQTKDEVDSYLGGGTDADVLLDNSELFICEESGTYNISLELNVTCMAWAYAQYNQSLGGTSPYGGYNNMYAELHLMAGSNDITLDSDTTNTNCIDGLANTALPRLDGLNPTINLSSTYSNSFSLNVGDKIYCYVKITQEGQYHMNLASKDDVQYVQYIESNGTNTFNVNFISYYPATNCDLYAINETFAEITEQITNDEMTIYSDYFGRTDAQPYTSVADGCGALMAITKGEKIRRIEIQGQQPTLEVSFKDVFDSINAIHNIGIGIETDTHGTKDKIIRIELVEYFYDSTTTLLTCDNVAEIDFASEPKLMYQNVSVGYDKYEAEEATGIDEFLTKREYSTQSTQISNKKEIISKFIAGGYTIEITRRVGNDDTSDWRYDKEVFIMCLKRDSGNLVIEQGNVTSGTNMVDITTLYNYAISPARNMMRWFKTIAASLVDYTTDVLTYTTGLGNVFASGTNSNSCAIESGVIAENQNISYSDFIDSTNATPLWKPETATFKYPLSYTDWKSIQSQPNGVVKFSHDDTNWTYGYILELGYSPTDGIATFKLLLTNN